MRDLVDSEYVATAAARPTSYVLLFQLSSGPVYETISMAPHIQTKFTEIEIRSREILLCARSDFGNAPGRNGVVFRSPTW